MTSSILLLFFIVAVFADRVLLIIQAGLEILMLLLLPPGSGAYRHVLLYFLQYLFTYFSGFLVLTIQLFSFLIQSDNLCLLFESISIIYI
jgi:hypothetical protein